MADGLRRPLARSLSGGRWEEYRAFLETALVAGYSLTSLHDWMTASAPTRSTGRVLIVRHDVDQASRSALAMAKIERSLGLRSLWYFRWRTADARVIERLRDAGCRVGLHYETLTRLALEGAWTPAADRRPDPQTLSLARRMLRRELYAFRTLFGEGQSGCAHGDTRVPGVLNTWLLDGENLADYGISFDGNLGLRGKRLQGWLTDRSRPDGSWADGRNPGEVFACGASPILAVVHPNNWCSGPSLWVDRVARATLPHRLGRARLARLSGALGDEPPW